MLLCANAALEENKQKINELNVFPVPDGDTGTNMSLTMNSAAIELGRKQTETVGAVADCAASALLRGARGNSGVILSLLFRGIAKSLKGRETANAAEFAAAVSNAGALGLIGAGGMTPDSLRENIRRCRELTDRPFGVNVMLMHPQVEEMVRVVAEERVMVVTTGAGDPARFIPAWKESGAKVFPVVPAVALAKVVEIGRAHV